MRSLMSCHEPLKRQPQPHVDETRILYQRTHQDPHTVVEVTQPMNQDRSEGDRHQSVDDQCKPIRENAFDHSGSNASSSLRSRNSDNLIRPVLVLFNSTKGGESATPGSDRFCSA